MVQLYPAMPPTLIHNSQLDQKKVKTDLCFIIFKLFVLIISRVNVPFTSMRQVRTNIGVNPLSNSWLKQNYSNICEYTSAKSYRKSLQHFKDHTVTYVWSKCLPSNIAIHVHIHIVPFICLIQLYKANVYHHIAI